MVGDFLHLVLHYVERLIVVPLRAIFSSLRKIRRIIYSVKKPSELEEKNLAWWRDQPVFKTSGSLYGHIDSYVGYPCGPEIEIVMKGWLFHPSKKFSVVSFPALSAHSCVALCGLERKDVLSAFASCTTARLSGFAVTAMIPIKLFSSILETIDVEATTEKGGVIGGSFKLPPCTACPTLPWSETEANSPLDLDICSRLAGKTILIASKLSPSFDCTHIDEVVFFLENSAAPPSKSHTDSLIFTNSEDLKHFIGHSVPVAAEILLMGEKVHDIVKDLSYIWLGWPKGGSIKFI